MVGRRAGPGVPREGAVHMSLGLVDSAQLESRDEAGKRVEEDTPQPRWRPGGPLLDQG